MLRLCTGVCTTTSTLDLKCLNVIRVVVGAALPGHPSIQQPIFLLLANNKVANTDNDELTLRRLSFSVYLTWSKSLIIQLSLVTRSQALFCDWNSSRGPFSLVWLVCWGCVDPLLSKIGGWFWALLPAYRVGTPPLMVFWALDVVGSAPGVRKGGC